MLSLDWSDCGVGSEHTDSSGLIYGYEGAVSGIRGGRCVTIDIFIYTYSILTTYTIIY